MSAKKKKKNNVAFIIIIIICIIVGAFSLYQIFKAMAAYNRIDQINEEVSAEVFQDDEFDLAAAKAINPDAIGFLYIPSVDSKLPIVQGADDSYYLTHAFDKSYSVGGSIFLAAGAENGINASHLLLYGHYMKNESMFGSHYRYKDKAFYDSGDNNIFYVYTENTVKTFKISSVMIEDPNSSVYKYNFNTQAGLESYARDCKEKSIYDTGVDVGGVTQVCSLSSCDKANADDRLIIQGVLVSEDTIK